MAGYSSKFSDRKKKLHRLLSILRMLDNRERCTPSILADKFTTTNRTIHRDMLDLGEAGFAIRFDKETATYTFADPDFTLRDFDLNSDELMALLLGKQIAQRLGKPFSSAFDSLLKKAHKDAGIKTKGKIKMLEEKQHFLVRMEPMEEFEKVENQYEAITEAMDNKVELEIAYKAMNSQKETIRQIAPYGLFYSNGLWYTIAYCHLQQDTRIFALDCIKDIKPTNNIYTIPKDFNIDDYFKPTWQMIRYGEPVEVVLKFSKDIARWIKRQKWHPSQQIEENKDGSIIFKVKIEGTEEIKWWTYRWVPYCEILAPAELRKEVAKDIKALAGIYEKED